MEGEQNLNNLYPRAYETVKRFTRNPMVNNIEGFLWKKQKSD